MKKVLKKKPIWDYSKNVKPKIWQKDDSAKTWLLDPKITFFAGSDLVAWLQAKLQIVETQVSPLLIDGADGVSHLYFGL